MSPAKIYTKLLHIEQMLSADNLINPEQMAKELGVNIRTLHNWRYAGKLEGCYTRNRGGQIMYDRAKVKDIRL